MTVKNMLDNFEIQGQLRVQSWNHETDDWDIHFDAVHNMELINKDYDWLNAEIEYMYPSTTEDDYHDIPQIVIEIEEADYND